MWYVWLDSSDNIIKFSSEDIMQYEDSSYARREVIDNEANGYVALDVDSDGNLVGLTDSDMYQRFNGGIIS